MKLPEAPKNKKKTFWDNKIVSPSPLIRVLIIIFLQRCRTLHQLECRKIPIFPYILILTAASSYDNQKIVFSSLKTESTETLKTFAKISFQRCTIQYYTLVKILRIQKK